MKIGIEHVDEVRTAKLAAVLAALGDYGNALNEAVESLQEALGGNTGGKFGKAYLAV